MFTEDQVDELQKASSKLSVSRRVCLGIQTLEKEEGGKVSIAAEHDVIYASIRGKIDIDDYTTDMQKNMYSFGWNWCTDADCWCLNV